VHEYQGRRLPIYHFDFIELKVWQRCGRLVLTRLFFGDGVSVIEWADRFADAIRRERADQV